MGTTIDNVIMARSIAETGLVPKDAWVIDLGAQEVHDNFDVARLDAMFRMFLPAEVVAGISMDAFLRTRYVGPIFERLGFRYSCIDTYEVEGLQGSVTLDLNFDQAPPHLLGQGDIVQNFGTTEHVCNQYNCFKLIHDVTKPGGFMWHNLPMSDFYAHGFFKYDPKFFTRLAVANKYEIRTLKFYRAPALRQIPDLLFDNGLPQIESVDTAIEILLYKTVDAPFAVPIDVDDFTLNEIAERQAAG